jgi:ketosteroid isomerase-like protein
MANEHEPEAVVRRLYEDFARGDVDAVLAALDPEVEWATPALPWSRGLYRGVEGVGEYLASFAAHLDAPRVQPEELVACGERVIGLGRERGRARATGREFAARFAHDFTVRDGRIARMRGLVDTAAIQAAFSPGP